MSNQQYGIAQIDDDDWVYIGDLSTGERVHFVAASRRVYFMIGEDVVFNIFADKSEPGLTIRQQSWRGIRVLPRASNTIIIQPGLD